MKPGFGSAAALSLLAFVSLASCNRGSEPAKPAAESGQIVLSTHAEPYPSLVDCLAAQADGTSLKEYEPHGAVDPNNPDVVVAAWMTIIEKGSGPLLVSASQDGGRTWSRPWPAPFTACSAPGVAPAPGPFASDPFVAFGGDGRAYVAGISIDADENLERFTHLSIALTASSDGGKTWGPLRYPVPNLYPAGAGGLGIDNVSVAADPKIPGRIFVATTRYLTEGNPKTEAEYEQSTRGPAAVTVSRDGGETWGELKLVSPTALGERTSAPQLIATPNAIHLIYYSETRQAARLERVSSTDGGETWSAPQKIVEIVRKAAYSERGTSESVGGHEFSTAEDIVSVAADRDGRRILIAYSDARDGDGASLFINVVESVDGGVSWSAPVRIGGRPGALAFFPNVAISAEGAAAVSFHEIDANHQGKDLPASVKLVRLDQAERTEEVVDTFDFAATNGGTGHYQGLVATRDAFAPIYVRTTCSTLDAACSAERPGGRTEVAAARRPLSPE